ncbi:MAG TPA: precorrin-6Y C5,15-methyltransferase (decarboxylating) subunit CbiT [Nitrososphaeraceae archaeon]|jgi:cobalt-precorrin-6B (C15)-methyltransferase
MLWEFSTPGIPDDLFERSENVPITKEDIRALAVSKLRLKEGFDVIEIGTGSGSLTVEICLQVKTGNVYSIDLSPEAIELAQRNLKRFGANARLILSQAQSAISSLPMVDAILIGGTLGDTEEIIKLSLQRLKSGGRIVIDTILIETLFKTLATLKQHELIDMEITQATICKSRSVSTGTMLLARNPVTIISATKT